MSNKETNNNPGLCSIKGQKSGPCSQVRARNQFSILSLCITRNTPQYQMLVFHPAFIFLLVICLEPPKKGSGPTNFWTKPPLASLSGISFPRIPECPGTQYSSTVYRIEISFNTSWHCRTNGDVVSAAWSAFRDSWLSEQTLTYFSGLSWVSISWTQANIATP